MLNNNLHNQPRTLKKYQNIFIFIVFFIIFILMTKKSLQY